MTNDNVLAAVTPKQAETWIEPLEKVIGNRAILAYFSDCLASQEPWQDANTLLLGEPGTAKTMMVISYWRRRLNNPALGYSEEIDFGSVLGGKNYGFMRIEGASVAIRKLERDVDVAMNNSTEHTFVLIDELGELFFRGFEEMLRPMLDCPDVTSFATAQNFHSKRRSDTPEETDARLRALLRRFRIRLRTENPGEEELVLFLANKVLEWGIACDSPQTLRLLAKKSSGIVGYAVGCLVTALATPCRKLTLDLVLRYEADPLNE